jgi:hypothetical protein
MTGALPDLSIFMLTLLAPERRRGWKEAPGAKAVAVATTAAKAMTLADMDEMKFQRTSQVFIVRSGGRNLRDIMTGLFIK